MVKVYKSYFERFFLLGGAVFIYIVFIFFMWINNANKLENIEINIAHNFQELKIYKNKYYLPSINILDPNGKIINLKKTKGRYTLLNIWATWCAPCIQELPSLKYVSKQLPYKSGWRVIAVSIDKPKNLSKVLEFTKRYNVSDIANFYDNNLELQNNININKLPVTLIINNEGRVIYKIQGASNWYDDNNIDFLKLVKKVY